LKKTAYIFACLAGVALCFSADRSSAGSWAAPDVMLISASMTQAGSSAGKLQVENPREQAAELLRRAREALAQNDLEGAEGLVRLAEATGAQFGPLHWGDTPKKVRKAIEKRRQASSKAFTLPSKLFSPKLFAKKDSTPKTDPFAKRNSSPQAPDLNDIRLPEGNAPQPGTMPGINPNDITHLPQVESLTLPRQVNPPPDAYPTTGMNPFLIPPGPAATSPGRGPARAAAPSMAARQKVAALTHQARAALSAGQLNQAESLAQQANRIQIPDSAFAPGEDCPARVLADIGMARRNLSRVIQAGGEASTTGAHSAMPGHVASAAVFDPMNDPTRNVQASSEVPGRPQGPHSLHLAQRPTPAAGPPTPAPPRPPVASPDTGFTVPGSTIPGLPTPTVTGATTGQSLFLQGEEALKNHDTERAYKLFREAAAHMNELDPITAERLQTKLQLMSVQGHSQQPAGPAKSSGNAAAVKQKTLIAQLLADIAHQQAEAEAKRLADPKGAIALLEESRKKVEQSGLDPPARQRLLGRVDRTLGETRKFIEQHRPLIELEESNNRTREEIERVQRVKLEKQDKLALMVDEFNKLMDEERFPEAELVAKKAAELAPESPLAKQLVLNAKFIRTNIANEALRAEKGDAFLATMRSVETAHIPFDDSRPFVYPDAERWEELTTTRRRLLERTRNRSPQEIEIEKRLQTPVSLQFENEPLKNVLEHLGQVTGVNMHIDVEGLREEGVTSDKPVSISLENEIMLKSALNLILSPLNLSYVVKDEVLSVTSEQLRDGEVYTETYDVGDLVIPIPNFVPSTRMGLAGAYLNAMGATGFGGAGPWGGTASSPMAVMASNEGAKSNAMVNPAVLAQMSQAGVPSGNTMPLGLGPGSLGGGTGADFDSLTDLITSTIQPTTWDAVGGPGSIAGFETNLSLVVSQTQEVHEEIVDLLEQLRRLQDLQVTIEVRFITLNDNFFERVGVDFDFQIENNIDRPYMVWGRPLPDGTRDTARDHTKSEPSVKAGMDAPGVFSADLDIPFQQNSFGLAVPQFGGFDATAGAQLGFAILSDIEAYFFINAAQGDRRSNVMQAPKVTLFNGQRAYVSDTSQSPFVISVIPIVGDFAAAQQPVIVVLTEGTFMTVQAVVSHDKRFVRLTVVPFFSQIEEVNTFQFEGAQTTTTNTTREGLIPGEEGEGDRFNNNQDETITQSSGTTVQLPTFSFVTVTTTVSVPDGGTVLLGGIKRLSEGRNEFGVPILNKIPYVNRLFKNVGIGREAQSLMMMVTPRIIIQEEEEEKLGIATSP